MPVHTSWSLNHSTSLPPPHPSVAHNKDAVPLNSIPQESSYATPSLSFYSTCSSERYSTVRMHWHRIEQAHQVSNQSCFNEGYRHSRSLAHTVLALADGCTLFLSCTVYMYLENDRYLVTGFLHWYSSFSFWPCASKQDAPVQKCQQVLGPYSSCLPPTTHYRFKQSNTHRTVKLKQS